MKTVIPTAVLLLGGAVFLARGDRDSSLPPREAIRTPAKGVETPVLEAPLAELTPEPAGARASVVVASTAPVAAPEPRPDPGAGLVVFFKRELALTEEQARGIAGILEDRARAVACYEAEVHQRGWFRIEDFDHRVSEMREFSYRRIASLLSADQTRRFAALWPVQLLAKDCIVVSLPEEKVITLD